MKRRVVITGMGVLTPAGNDLATFQDNLRAGRSGLGPITSFDTERFPVKSAYEVKNFDPHRNGTQLLDPFIQYAIAATTEAVKSSGFDTTRADPYRIGIAVSSSKGGIHTIGRFKERFLKHPSAILGARIYSNAVPNFAAQWIARRWKIKGPAKCYIAACATGAVAVAEGARMVRDGDVDSCIAGSTDASIEPLMLAGYHNMKVLAPERLLAFDRRRRGFMVGDGAGIVFMETLESAKARGAKIHGEFLGAGFGHGGSNPINFNPDEDGLVRTIRNLLGHTGLAASGIGYINLHGTGTRSGDIYETEQLKKVFGRQAYHIPMSSTKGITGHMLGAAGSVEAVVALSAMEHGFIPPTVDLEEPDPRCDLDYTALRFRTAKVPTAVSISMGFGGQIAAIAFGKV